MLSGIGEKTPQKYQQRQVCVPAQPTENANELSNWNDNWLDREDEVPWSAFALADEEGSHHSLFVQQFHSFSSLDVTMKPAVRERGIHKQKSQTNKHTESLHKDSW